MSATAARPESGRARRRADRMLPASFDLRFTASGETVEDVEALIRGVLGAERWPSYLEPADEADLIGTLLGDAVLLERQYRPKHGIEARPWLFERLRFKARDWRRRRLRQAPVLGELPGLEGLDGDDGHGGTGLGRGEQREGDRRSGIGDGSHGSPGEVAGDRGDPGLDALRGLLEGGDRSLLREIEALGLGPPPGARARTETAREAFDRLERNRLDRVALLDRERVAA